jgi:hypothetical protein
MLIIEHVKCNIDCADGGIILKTSVPLHVYCDRRQTKEVALPGLPNIHRKRNFPCVPGTMYLIGTASLPPRKPGCCDGGAPIWQPRPWK